MEKSKKCDDFGIMCSTCIGRDFCDAYDDPTDPVEILFEAKQACQKED